jgi:hypothetical protein
MTLILMWWPIHLRAAHNGFTAIYARHDDKRFVDPSYSFITLGKSITFTDRFLI